MKTNLKKEMEMEMFRGIENKGLLAQGHGSHNAILSHAVKMASHEVRIVLYSCLYQSTRSLHNYTE